MGLGEDLVLPQSNVSSLRSGSEVCVEGMLREVGGRGEEVETGIGM